MDIDLEFEDVIATSRVAAPTRRKVIGLDDLVSDYYKEKEEATKRSQKRGKHFQNSDSEEDERSNEAFLLRKIDECNDQMKDMDPEDEPCATGLSLFGVQKVLPQIFCNIASSSMVQRFRSNDLNSIFGLVRLEDTSFFEGLLVNGWLLKVVNASGKVDKVICKWSFDLIMYSVKAELMLSAREFWSAVCEPKKVFDIQLEWVPAYSDLQQAIEIYGYAFCTSTSEPAIEVSHCRGPPQNFCHWLKFVAMCFRNRCGMFAFTPKETESFLEIVISLSLDRNLQALLLLILEAVRSLINYFKEEEWNKSCRNVAANLAGRIPVDLNCLRVVEFIPVTCVRCSQLKSAISYHILSVNLGCKGKKEEEMLSSLMAIKIKDRKCDLLKVYINMVLAEKWILWDPISESKKEMNQKFGVFLRNCASSISSSDMRTYASKVRAKAAFLLHGFR